MNNMQQQAPQQRMNSTPPQRLNLISTEQIQKYLEENRNLIMAIMENQNLGKMAECVQYQAILQRNLMYLAALADVQPQESAGPSQLPSDTISPQGNSHMLQTHGPTMQQQQQQPTFPNAKLPFQLNTPRPQDQQNQLLQFQQQQQLQAHFSRGGGGLQLLMQPGHSNSSNLMDFRGSQQGASEANSGNGQGRSG